MRKRVHIKVQGIVQGVGFRPFVYGLALRHGLVGYVLNDAAGVTIEVEGEPTAVEAFLRMMREGPPPLARVEQVQVKPISLNGDKTFVIAPSDQHAEKRTFISPDVSLCADCLQELYEPSDHRYHYPFINCTNCGPRFTIVEDVPYDRPKTTMRQFVMCPVCQAEYDDPLNRRFHAQPNACPNCGPQVYWLDARLRPVEAESALEKAADQLVDGAILALKGLGGYHLVCDALNAESVIRLRQRKRRNAKPFAVMAADLDTARQICCISAIEAEVLLSRRRPIVLLNRQIDSPLPPAVAPCYSTVGVMLPYTPLHQLLLDAFAQAVGPGHLALLVMTSGNLSDEPIAYEDDEARTRLAPLVDGWLIHNRAIHMRCDDSVVRVVHSGIPNHSGTPNHSVASNKVEESVQIFRRARGYAPEPIRLSRSFPMSLLACGGHLKNTFCLGKENYAFMSHHIGDLENLETLASFQQGIDHFQRLFNIQPQVVAHDLHPNYLATQVAQNLDVPYKIGVQHHHAHIASVLAEHGLVGPVIGIAADGTGYGSDGAIWGGEILIADLYGFERVAHLAYVPLPGGELAIHQPWRMATVYLAQTFGDAWAELDIPFVTMPHVGRSSWARWRPLAQMIQHNVNSPPTSSLGRLFDAVAALVGLREVMVYEGQAAIELEAQAQATDQIYPFLITQETPALLDVRPMIKAIVEDLQQGASTAQIAGRFHATIAELLAVACVEARRQYALNVVALSGGVFQNRLLLEGLLVRLQRLGFDVFRNRLVPPNDGGLSLGQAAVAAAQVAL